MDIPTKKLKNGFEMPVFGMGTFGMGGGTMQRLSEENDAKEVAIIQATIERGVRHIDTAEIYARGFTEKIVGQAIAKYPRDKLFLVSKAFTGHFHKNDLIASCRASLARLGTTYLDMYLLHRYPGDDLLKESLDTLNELANQRVIKHIGISNFSLEHTKRAQQLSRRPIAATQVHYNLIYREPEKSGLLDYCQKNEIMLIAWRPVERGTLTEPGTEIVDRLCKKYQKTPAQVAINWIVTQPNVVTLAKTSNIEHLEENLGGVGWSMDALDMELLTQSFPKQQGLSNAVPLG